MKKLSMLCTIFLLFGAGYAYAQAPTYQFANAGTKNFITEPTITVNTRISLDLYLSNVIAPQYSGGAWIDFTGSTAEVSYVSGGRCFIDGSEGCTGLWTSGVGALANEPEGLGTFYVQVANLEGAAPDVNGDLIVGTVTLECSAEGDATVSLSPIPVIPTWAPINDIDVVPGSLLIHQVYDSCTADNECDDGNSCNGEESCDVGGTDLCQPGTPLVCDDGNVCTNDSCDPATGCVSTDNTASCNDGNACTTADTCAGGSCVGGAAPNCDDGNVCTNDSCDPASGCVSTDNTASCDDGNACTTSDTCSGGTCVGGAAPNCDDGNVCTNDSCDPASGCVSTDNTASCDDGNACTTSDTCSGGTCVGGAAPNCDDGNVCTNDSCDPASGCVSTDNTASCDDGNACTTSDTCSGGACIGGAAPNCDDGNVCTNDSCDPATGCQNSAVAEGISCSNSLYCDGEESCQGGACIAGTPPGMDDGIVCTNDSCDEEEDQILHIPDNTLCDDGAFCNGAEVCDAALDCQPGTAPVVDDGNECTEDSCDEVNDVVVNDPALLVGELCMIDTGICQEDGSCLVDCIDDIDCDDGVACTVNRCDMSQTPNRCVYEADDTLCDDLLFCNGAEVCDAALDCQPGTAPVVDDSNECTEDSCDEVNDVVVNDPAPLVGELCMNNAGTCEGDGTCLVMCMVDVECGDGIGCTRDWCDTSLFPYACAHEADDTLCDDGEFCTGVETCDPVNDCQPGTGDPCVPDVCDEVNNVCKNCLVDGDCDDGIGCTDDTCDPGTSSCVFTPDDASCDDGEFCTGVETCDPVNDCQPGTAPNCDDGNVCTDDSCDPATGCVSTNNTASCDDGNACTTADTCAGGSCVGGAAPNCDDGNVCTNDSCDPATGCVSTNNTASCDDGNACTTADTCSGGACLGGAAPNCDDGNVCTNDSCDPASGCVSTDNTASCNDGNACTTADTCAGGSCVGGAAPNCDDGNVCTNDSCDPASGCVSTDNTASCDDGNACTTSDTCAGGTCLGGPAPNCDDGNVCTNDSCDPATGCQNSAVADGISCSNSLYCDGEESCQGGACIAGTPPGMDDGIVCTNDSCDEEEDQILHIPDNTLCDDGAFCNGVEVCDAGLGCQPGTAPVVDDSNECTEDSCDEVNDVVVNDPAPLVGELCMIDTGICQEDGSCLVDCIDDIDCDDGVACTVNRCDMSQTPNRCVYEADDTLCDDLLFCNGAEVCDAALDCQPGTAPVVDDSNECTEDSCDEVNDVVVNDPAPLVGELCMNNAGTCEGDGTCLVMCMVDVECGDGIGCTRDWCDTSLFPYACAHEADDTLCDDGEFCTGVETCDPVNDCQPGPGDPCVPDVCDEDLDECVNGEDTDGDGVPDSSDNCLNTPNPGQEDTSPPQGNDIGDACDCECDFSCDGDVDADDVEIFLADFGRNAFNDPCDSGIQCKGDFTCDGDVDADDVTTFLEDFGRNPFNNPCPQCVTGDWCVYP